MHRTLRLASVLLIGLPSGLTGQSLEGVVVDGVSGAPVYNATVSIISRAEVVTLRAVSDSLGFFQVPLPRPDTIRVRFEALGYETVSSGLLSVGQREIVSLEVALSVQALELEPVVVTARREDSRRARRALSQFYRRYDWGQKSGFGKFFTREDLEEVSFLSHELIRIPGFRYRYNNGRMSVGSRMCPAHIYLNGLRVGTNNIDEFWPEDLEAIEVYRRESEIPIEFKRPGVCTVVALWTRIGEPTSGGRYWARMGLFGALVGGFLTYVITN